MRIMLFADLQGDLVPFLDAVPGDGRLLEDDPRPEPGIIGIVDLGDLELELLELAEDGPRSFRSGRA